MGWAIRMMRFSSVFQFYYRKEENTLSLRKVSKNYYLYVLPDLQWKKQPQCISINRDANVLENKKLNQRPLFKLNGNRFEVKFI